jgi:hypothetical protein
LSQLKNHDNNSGEQQLLNNPIVNNTQSNSNRNNKRFQLSTLSKRKKEISKSSVDLNKIDLFSTIYSDDIDTLKLFLMQKNHSGLINNINSIDFPLTPLDFSIMLNKINISKLLMEYGGVESPIFTSCEERYDKICSYLNDLNCKLNDFLKSFQICSQTSHHQLNEIDVKLNTFHKKIDILKTMKQNYEKPMLLRNNVLSLLNRPILQIYNSKSIQVNFNGVDGDPTATTTGDDDILIVKFKIEWSCHRNFDQILGSTTILNIFKNKTFKITNLIPNNVYYVRVSYGYIRGFTDFIPTDPEGLTLKRKLFIFKSNFLCSYKV